MRRAFRALSELHTSSFRLLPGIPQFVSDEVVDHACGGGIEPQPCLGSLTRTVTR